MEIILLIDYRSITLKVLLRFNCFLIEAYPIKEAVKKERINL